MNTTFTPWSSSHSTRDAAMHTRCVVCSEERRFPVKCEHPLQVCTHPFSGLFDFERGALT